MKVLKSIFGETAALEAAEDSLNDLTLEALQRIGRKPANYLSLKRSSVITCRRRAVGTDLQAGQTA